MGVKTMKKAISAAKPKKAAPAPRPRAGTKKAAGGGLERSIIVINENIDRHIDRLGEKIERQGENIDRLGEKIERQGENIDRLGENIDRRIDRLGEKIERQGENIDRIGEKIERQGENIDRLGEKIERQGENIDRIGERIDKAVLSMENSLAVMTARMAESDAKIAESNADIKASLAKLAKLDTVVDGVKSELGGLSESNGRAVESIAHSFFEARMTFAGVRFDDMEIGVNRRRKLPDGTKIQGEYDVVLYNGSAVALIEAKHRVRRADINKLIDTQMPRFKLFYPQYKDFTYYLGLCGLSFEDGVEEEALERGLGTLKPNGDAVEINETTVKAW